MWVAHDQGYFEDEGLKVTLKSYATVADLAAAISKREMDGGPLAAPAAVLFAERGRYLIVAGNSINGTAIACKPENAGKYKVLTDLEGARLASVRYVPGDTVIRYMLMKEDIQVKVTACLASSDAMVACKKDMVDVAILWEPFVSLAEKEGLAIVFWDKEIYGATYPCCLQVFNEDSVRQNPSLIVKYLKALLRAEAYCRENPEKAASIAFKYLSGIPGMTKEIAYRSVFWKDPRLNDARNPLSVHLKLDDLKKYVDMMVELEMVSKKDAAAFLARVDLSYLQKALAS